MRRTSHRVPLGYTLALVVRAFLLAPPAIAAPRAQQGGCFFTAGFKAVHDLLPTTVGAGLKNERFNVENGNAEQCTTGGLLVRRKADNWTAFMDGATTWINGPNSLESRANAERFPWEPMANPAPRPVMPSALSNVVPPTLPLPAPPPVPPPPDPETVGGPILTQPEDIVLRQSDMGKEIEQDDRKSATDARSAWAEVRFERDRRRLNANFGPVKITNRVYVAEDVASARAILSEETGRQAKMPEADRDDKVGGTFRLDGINRVGDDQDTVSACSPSCTSSEQVLVHHRAVVRHQNVVAVPYFFGAENAALQDVDQVNEWLGKIRERMG